MDAAARLFIARGVDATTIDDIVASADVAKGTFYHYFPAKTDVVAALRDRFAQGFVARVGEAVADHAAAAVDAYLDAFELHDVVFHDYRHERRQSSSSTACMAWWTMPSQAARRTGAGSSARSATCSCGCCSPAGRADRASCYSAAFGIAPTVTGGA
jgi:AcrR family transcriptional regulator